MTPTEVTDPRAMERILRFRFEVWAATGLMAPGAFPEGAWRDPLDDVARHFVIEAEGRLVAAARFTRFERMSDMPEAAHYRSIGLDLEGAVGLPERVVVAPDHQRAGVFAAVMSEFLSKVAQESGVRWSILEVRPELLPLMLRDRPWRRAVGPGAHDPRFPTVHFQLILSDMARLGSGSST